MDKEKIKSGILKIVVPPAFSHLLQGKIAPTPRVVKEVELGGIILKGGGTLETATGKPKEKLTREEAVSRLILGSRSPEARLNSEGWDEINSMESKYSNLHDDALKLLSDGKQEEARKMVHEYNQETIPKLKEMKIKYKDATDIVLKDRIKKAQKGFVVSTEDFQRWKKELE